MSDTPERIYFSPGRMDIAYIDEVDNAVEYVRADHIEALENERYRLREMLKEVIEEFDELDNGRSLRWTIDSARIIIRETKEKGLD